MKIFSLLMSFLLLAMMAIPCQDTLSCNENRSVVVSEGHNHAEKFHLDNCSPLCSCVCCASNAAIQGSAMHSTPLNMHTGYRFYAPDAPVYDYVYPVWQPPQA